MLFLALAMGLAAVIQGASAYRTALAEADDIFDYQMQQVALTLRAAMGEGAPLPLGDEQSLDLIVQVWGLDGTPLYRTAGPAWLPQRAVLGFSTVQLQGKRYRVLAVLGRSQLVQVAQDLAVRQRMATQLAWRTVAPIALMLPLLIALVWWVLGRSLAPVARVQAELAQRHPGALEPVNATELPTEVQPLVREFNQLLARLQQAFDAQQQFVADAAHELRSPLAALKLQLEALRRAADATSQAAAQDRLGQGIDRAARLVEQLLALARQDSAALGSPQTLALDALCREAVVEASTLAQHRGLDLGLGRCDALSVAGQPQALRMLLRNVLDNAIKYGRQRADLSLVAEGGEALLVLEDDGPGIAEAERERVFDRFYRAPAQAQQASGSGLGLAIAQRVAQAHGGSLALRHSTALGGLRLELRLPLLNTAQGAAPSDSPKSTRADSATS
ncbi:ATP-binding protein [Roseateles sp. BYS180W]|uniref:histidine kinase n=1 Tax=Roseateles rivi TaxID=3299028 RepID=A0ABW7FUY4_9BURK